MFVAEFVLKYEESVYILCFESGRKDEKSEDLFQFSPFTQIKKIVEIHIKIIVFYLNIKYSCMYFNIIYKIKYYINLFNNFKNI